MLLCVRSYSEGRGKMLGAEQYVLHATSKGVSVPSNGVYVLLHLDGELVSGETSFENSKKLLRANVLRIDADSIV